MELIADGLLIAAAVTATIYCFVLSRRLHNLNSAGAGIGDQIRELDKTLTETRAALKETQEKLGGLKGSARVATEKLAREVWLAKETLAELTSAREGVLEKTHKPEVAGDDPLSALLEPPELPASADEDMDDAPEDDAFALKPFDPLADTLEEEDVSDVEDRPDDQIDDDCIDFGDDAADAGPSAGSAKPDHDAQGDDDAQVLRMERVAL